MENELFVQFFLVLNAVLPIREFVYQKFINAYRKKFLPILPVKVKPVNYMLL